MNLKRSILISTLLLATASLVAADSVTLKNSSAFDGEILEMQGGYLVLQLSEQQGIALRRISPSEIESLTFDDASDSLQQRALRRSRFQTLLSMMDATVLVDFLNSEIESGNALSALVYAKQWHPKNNYTALDAAYRTVLIKSALASDSHSEAVIHARNWLAQTPKPYQDLLPWEIVANDYLARDFPEEALWIALQPIANASGHNQDALSSLKEIAAQSYRNLGYDSYGNALLSDLPTNQGLSSLQLPSLAKTPLPFSQILKTQSP